MSILFTGAFVGVILMVGVFLILRQTIRQSKKREIEKANKINESK